jgi:SAM-dependent methyltransferase
VIIFVGKKITMKESSPSDSFPVKDGSNLNHPQYDSKQRFCSYWHQINEILKLSPDRMIEIGIGNGFVSDYLRKRSVCVLGVDIRRKPGTDIVADVIHLPFKDSSCDIVACYQVLEHLPYQGFLMALKEMHRVAKDKVLISISDVTPVVPVCFILPLQGPVRWLVPVPKIRKKRIPGKHEWEVGRSPYDLKFVVKDIQKAGYNVDRTYRVFENPYHRFFILSKIGG